MSQSATNITTWRRRYVIAAVATCVSLIVWVLTCAFAVEFVQFGYWILSVDSGCIAFTSGGGWPGWHWGGEWYVTRAWAAPAWLPWLCTSYSPHADYSYLVPHWGVGVPVWPVPAACVLLARRTRHMVLRLRTRCCESCGYDLSATAATLPCPECGGQRGVAHVLSAAARARRVKRWKHVRLIAIITASCMLALLALATRWDMGIARGKLTTVMTQRAYLTCGWASVDTGQPWRWVCTRRNEKMPSPFARTAWLSFGDWWDATTQTPAWHGGRLWLSLYALSAWSLAAIAFAHWRVHWLSTPRCQFCGYETRGLAAGACCPECGRPCSV